MNYITALDSEFYLEEWPRFREQLGSHVLQEYVLRYETIVAWENNSASRTTYPKVWAIVLDDYAKVWLNLQHPHWIMSEHTK